MQTQTLNIRAFHAVRAEEILKEPGAVIFTEAKEILQKCAKAETLAEGSGVPTELRFTLVPTTQECILFRVNNTWVEMRASSTVKMMIQNAWSTTSKLRPCVCYDNKGRVTWLCLIK